MDTLGIIRQMKQDPALRDELRALLLSEELLALPERVARIEEGLARLEEMLLRMSDTFDRRVAALEEGQARLEGKVDKLEEGQARIEGKVDRLEEGQARLEEGQAKLRTEVGKLSVVVGGTVEVDAVEVLTELSRRWGWELLAAPAPAQVNGEADVVMRARDAAGEEVAIVCEAKARLRPRDVERFAESLPGIVDGLGLTGTVFGYVYGLVLYAGVEEAAGARGLYVIDFRGERGTLRQPAAA